MCRLHNYIIAGQRCAFSDTGGWLTIFPKSQLQLVSTRLWLAQIVHRGPANQPNAIFAVVLRFHLTRWVEDVLLFDKTHDFASFTVEIAEMHHIKFTKLNWHSTMSMFLSHCLYYTIRDLAQFWFQSLWISYFSVRRKEVILKNRAHAMCPP